MPKKLQTILLEKYKAIEPYMVDYNSHSLDALKDEQFTPLLRAAFVKCFEFNIDINRIRNNQSFYYMPFLRGICEDLISLSFLSKLKNEDRNKVTLIYNQYLVQTSILAQTAFFDKEDIDTPVIRLKNTDVLVKESEDELKIFWHEKDYNKDKIFHSVEHMAIDSSLKLLYDFLYHATSRAVIWS